MSDSHSTDEGTEMSDKPAFPLTVSGKDAFGETQTYPLKGLTRRELFAAMAMRGMCASEHWGANADESPSASGALASAAVAVADALLEALSNAQA